MEEEEPTTKSFSFPSPSMLGDAAESKLIFIKSLFLSFHLPVCLCSNSKSNAKSIYFPEKNTLIQNREFLRMYVDIKCLLMEGGMEYIIWENSNFAKCTILGENSASNLREKKN